MAGCCSKMQAGGVVERCRLDSIQGYFKESSTPGVVFIAATASGEWRDGFTWDVSLRRKTQSCLFQAATATEQDGELTFGDEHGDVVASFYSKDVVRCGKQTTVAIATLPPESMAQLPTVVDISDVRR